MNSAAIMCPYHNVPARFRETSAHIYRGRDYGPVWECSRDDCDAYCGCHHNGLPLGQLANKELRVARMRTHQLFDALWRGDIAQRLAYPEEIHVRKKLADVMRGRAYHWLAYQMGISDSECHTAKFDVAQCERAIQILRDQKPTAASIRDWHKQNKAEAYTK